MREYFKSYTSLAATAIAFILGWCGIASANTIRPTVTVFIDLWNAAQTPASLVTKAKKEAEKVYRDIGIQLVWTSAALPTGGLNLTVVLVPNKKAALFVEAEEKLGRAIGNQGRGARRAYVFPDSARDLVVRSSGVNEAR